MNGRFLLDTNILIALFAEDTNVIQNLANSREVFIPCIVVGELFYGARRSGRVEANVQRVEELAGASIVLNCDVETAKHYSLTKNSLRSKGKPIPENDIWIAAIALQNNLSLVTRDAHFQEVEGLIIEQW